MSRQYLRAVRLTVGVGAHRVLDIEYPIAAPLTDVERLVWVPNGATVDCTASPIFEELPDPPAEGVRAFRLTFTRLVPKEELAEIMAEAWARASKRGLDPAGWGILEEEVGR